MTNQIYYSNDYNIFLKHIKPVLKKEFGSCKKIAIKLHFGEPGNKTALTPEQVKPITDILDELDIGFFFYDSSVAYPGERHNPETHKRYATEKGWVELGEVVTGDSFIEKRGKHLKYEVCKELADAEGVLVLTHVKGHVCSGFGGAIKNLGMGALTPKSKQDIHDGAKPEIVAKCIQCGECVRACPINGIKLEDEPKFVTCFGCSNCVIACPSHVLKVKLETFDELLADGATAAASTFKKAYYISLMNNITAFCDCMKDGGKIIAKDAGYLGGPDAVGIDQAAYDIITKHEGEVFLKHNKKKGTEQIRSAQKLGLGKKEYSLIECS